MEQNELSEAIVADVAASLKGVMRHIGESDEDDDLLDETKSSVRFLCSTLERLLFNGVKDAHFWPLVESLGVCLFFCANRQAAPLTAIAPQRNARPFRAARDDVWSRLSRSLISRETAPPPPQLRIVHRLTLPPSLSLSLSLSLSVHLHRVGQRDGLWTDALHGQVASLGTDGARALPRVAPAGLEPERSGV